MVGAQIAQSHTHLLAGWPGQETASVWKIQTSSAEKRPAFLMVQCIFVFNCYLLSCLTSPAK